MDLTIAAEVQTPIVVLPVVILARFGPRAGLSDAFTIQVRK
jgi:hypothetical protein